MINPASVSWPIFGHSGPGSPGNGPGSKKWAHGSPGAKWDPEFGRASIPIRTAKTAVLLFCSICFDRNKIICSSLF